MAIHSYVRLHVHLIWSTKDRQKLLNPKIRSALCSHMMENAGLKSIDILRVNVQPDHAHLLIQLRSDQRLDELVKLIKGESSHWINEQELVQGGFAWQRGYSAFSVSRGHIDRVRRYIENQDEHHRRRSFEEEYRLALERNGFASPAPFDQRE